jgi:hypothetical protein
MLLLGGILLVLGIGTFVAVAIWQCRNASAILEDNAIWKIGVPAIETRVIGDVTTQEIFFGSYNLRISYTTVTGARFSRDSQFDTFLGFTNPEAARPEVRYLPNDPSKFVLEWAVDQTRGRWIMLGFLSTFGALMGIALTYTGLTYLRRYYDARRCAFNSTEIALHILAIAEVSSHGRPVGVTYKFEWFDPSGCRRVGKETFSIKEQPLFSDGTQTSIVALVSDWAPRRPVVLRSDLSPFMVLCMVSPG